MKAQARDHTHAPAGAVGKPAADCACGVFDDRESAKRFTDLGRSRWVAELIDHERRFHVRGPRGSKCLTRAVPFVRVDIDESDACASQPRRMRGARPAERRANYLVSLTDSKSLERELKRCCSARHRDSVTSPDQCGYGLLEALYQRPLNQLSGFENRGDSALLILADPRFC